jgi:hypothetical protein
MRSRVRPGARRGWEKEMSYSQEEQLLMGEKTGYMCACDRALPWILAAVMISVQRATATGWC